MGRGRGQAEHNQDEEKTTAVEDARPRTDDSDEEEAYAEEREKELARQIQAEKTIEQVLDEAHREWTRYFYAPWSKPVFWGLFIVSIINMVLTLDQWHGTRGWRLPLDLIPRDRRYGGWPDINNACRYGGGCIGIIGSCFTWVMSPSADKYKCLFVFLFMSSLLLFCAFGYDWWELQDAKKSLDICSNSMKIPDMHTHRYICTYEDYIATCLIGFLAASFNFFMAVYVCRLALTGAVSRVRVWSEQQGKFEKKTPNPDEDTLMLFPRRFRMQWPRMNRMLLFGGILNIAVVALSITQSSGTYLEQGTGYKHPTFNNMNSRPVTLFVVHGDEYGPRIGGWPQTNFEFRLSAGALAIVTTAFTIQWRRDGRSTQLFVISLMILAGILYLACGAKDLSKLVRTIHDGCQWMEGNGFMCMYRRYLAVAIIDVFLSTGFLLFGTFSLHSWFQQAKSPGNPWSKPAEIQFRKENPTHPWGWYYNGEWAEKKAIQDAEKLQEMHLAGEAAEKARQSAMEDKKEAAPSPYGEEMVVKN